MKIAVVGATGLVGGEILRVLAERQFPLDELYPVASARSIGREIDFRGRQYTVTGLEEGVSLRPDIAIFSAGGTTSLEWAPRFADAGTVVIDNSSAWRMDPDKKLIVPEINGSLLTRDDRIIANPNCSTIQMVLALTALQQRIGIDRIVVSTYQSVTGTGKAAVDQLENERKGLTGDKVYPYPIDKNILPHIDVFLDNGYTREEMKMVNETRKIFGDDHIRVTATCVRVPTVGGHAESVNVTLRQPVSVEEARQMISGTAGVTLQDDPEQLLYPMPVLAQGQDEVFVGRIRQDDTQPNTLNMWIVADNLRKGAATNAVQIAEYLINHRLV